MKPAIFHSKARKVLKSFPLSVRKSVGKAILDLQKGYHLSMPLSRPMPSITLGTEEVRIKDANGIYRTFYYKKSKKGILIFHAFVKNTQKTPVREIRIARKRLKELLDEKT